MKRERENCGRLVSSRTIPRRLRSANGNMLFLLLAVTFGFVLTIFMFTFNYARVVIGTSHEQKTAIEAAALACAKDLSRIVVEDPNFGFVGLSDSAPVGNATKAKDGYDLQVHGINSILATVRLDLIIAHEIGDPTMLQFAQADYRNALMANQNLINVLQAAILPNNATFYSDCFGNVVTPYEDAVAAYQANQVRIAGFSQYVPGSMKLSLGSILGGAQTNTPLPHPMQFANVTSSGQQLGNYVSYVNEPYGGFDFVFAGLGDAITLVDPAKFVMSDQSLPFTIPTIVKAEADQQFAELSGNTPHIIHSLACAQPASTVDPVPAPGKFSISFINGLVAGLTKPADLLNDFQLKNAQANLMSPTGGDYPNGGGTLAPTTWSASNSTASISQVISGSLYDWMRKAGTKVNIQSVKSMLDLPFLATLPPNVSQTHNYEFGSDGHIAYNLQQRSSSQDIDISDNQLYATGKYTTNSAPPFAYAITIKDFVHKQGRLLGGKHAGEPPQLNASSTTSANNSTPETAANVAQAATLKSQYLASPALDPMPKLGSISSNATYIGGGGSESTSQTNATESTVRPTYLHNGLAAEVKFARVP